MILNLHVFTVQQTQKTLLSPVLLGEQYQADSCVLQQALADFENENPKCVRYLSGFLFTAV